jgi:hypothetical protein
MEYWSNGGVGVVGAILWSLGSDEEICERPSDLTRRSWHKPFYERALEAELDAPLGYGKRETPGRRKVSDVKTIVTATARRRS